MLKIYFTDLMYNSSISSPSSKIPAHSGEELKLSFKKMLNYTSGLVTITGCCLQL